MTDIPPDSPARITQILETERVLPSGREEIADLVRARMAQAALIEDPETFFRVLKAMRFQAEGLAITEARTAALAASKSEAEIATAVEKARKAAKEKEKDPLGLGSIRDRLWREAVEQNPRIVLHLTPRVPFLETIAVGKDPYLIFKIPDPCEASWVAALEQKPDLIAHVPNPSSPMWAAALYAKPELIDAVAHPTPTMWAVVFQRKPERIREIPEGETTTLMWDKVLEKKSKLVLELAKTRNDVPQRHIDAALKEEERKSRKDQKAGVEDI